MRSNNTPQTTDEVNSVDVRGSQLQLCTTEKTSVSLLRTHVILMMSILWHWCPSDQSDVHRAFIGYLRSVSGRLLTSTYYSKPLPTKGPHYMDSFVSKLPEMNAFCNILLDPLYLTWLAFSPNKAERPHIMNIIVLIVISTYLSHLNILFCGRWACLFNAPNVALSNAIYSSHILQWHSWAVLWIHIITEAAFFC